MARIVSSTWNVTRETCHLDRIGREEQYIEELYPGIVGTIQPGVARQLFAIEAGSDDVFFERFGLVANPDRLTDWELVDQFPDRDAREGYNRVCDVLAGADWEELLPKGEYDDNRRPRGAEDVRLPG